MVNVLIVQSKYKEVEKKNKEQRISSLPCGFACFPLTMYRPQP